MDELVSYGIVRWTGKPRRNIYEIYTRNGDPPRRCWEQAKKPKSPSKYFLGLEQRTLAKGSLLTRPTISGMTSPVLASTDAMEIGSSASQAREDDKIDG
jgi:hypothetical protein